METFTCVMAALQNFLKRENLQIKIRQRRKKLNEEILELHKK